MVNRVGKMRRMSNRDKVRRVELVSEMNGG
jgi:hypothetical protein